MSYQPRFSISTDLLSLVEEITRLRERIQGATIQVTWIPALQKDARIRNAHSSTAIEGNPLTLEQVRAVESQPESAPAPPQARREVLNYFAALRYVEKNAAIQTLTHDAILRLHAIMAGQVMDQGVAGAYREIQVRVGPHVPPPPEQVSGLMTEWLEWWNLAAPKLSPVLSSAILHYRFEDIHPFADGNGRTGRAVALWELYRRGFDSHHIFSVDEYFWEDRPQYYAALQAVRTHGQDLSQWLEYCARGLRHTLERVWRRVQQFSVQYGKVRLVLRPRQEQLLAWLRDEGGLSPRDIRTRLGVSKQGAMDLLHPLLAAGLVKRTGTLKTGRYVLVGSQEPGGLHNG